MATVGCEPCTPMRSRLDGFIRRALADNIWVAIDAEAIDMAAPGSDFTELVMNTLETAGRYCRMHASDGNRSIRLRSKFINSHLLVKIQYSCRNDDSSNNEELTGLVTAAHRRGYYFKSLYEDNMINLNIAADLIRAH